MANSQKNMQSVLSDLLFAFLQLGQAGGELRLELLVLRLVRQCLQPVEAEVKVASAFCF